MKNKIIFGCITVLLISFVTFYYIKTNNAGKTNNEVEIYEDKVNIYLFYRNGCPHCEKLMEYLDSIKSEYGKYYNLYTYEVSANKDNYNLLNKYAKLMDDEVKGVPYMIIGSKSIVGYMESFNDQIIDYIIEEKDNDFDVSKL